MAVQNPETMLSTTLGRHTRLDIPFTWTMDGVLVDLEADGYTVRVWVTAVDGTTTAAPTSADVSGTKATYSLAPDDLADASTGTSSRVKITAVAENGTYTLPPATLSISVGDWGGADDYTPVL